MRAGLAVMSETGMKDPERVMETGTVVVGLEPFLGDEDPLGGIAAPEFTVTAHEILVPGTREDLGEKRRGALGNPGVEQRTDDRPHDVRVTAVGGSEPLVEIEDVVRTGSLAERRETAESRRPLEPDEIGRLECPGTTQRGEKCRKGSVIADFFVGPGQKAPVLKIPGRDLLEPLQRGQGVLVPAAGDLEFGLGQKHGELGLGRRLVGGTQVAVPTLVTPEKLSGPGGHQIVHERGLGVGGGAGESALGARIAAFGELDETADELRAGDATPTLGSDPGKPAASAEKSGDKRPEEEEDSAGGEPEEHRRREVGLNQGVTDAHGHVAVRMHPEEKGEDDRGGQKDEKPEKRLHALRRAFSAEARARRTGAREGGRVGKGRTTRARRVLSARMTAGLRTS